MLLTQVIASQFQFYKIIWISSCTGLGNITILYQQHHLQRWSVFYLIKCIKVKTQINVEDIHMWFIFLDIKKLQIQKSEKGKYQRVFMTGLNWPAFARQETKTKFMLGSAV